MPLREIAKEYGGYILHGGWSACIRGPGHGKDDRSVSLRLDVETNRLLINSFGGSDFREVKDMLREDGHIDARGIFLRGRGGGAHSRNDGPASTLGAKVQPIWSDAIPTGHTLSEIYIRQHRDIGRDTSGITALRHSYAVQVSLSSPHSKFVKPALLGKITDSAGRHIGLEISYLKPSGERETSDRIRIPRKSIGPLKTPHQIQIDDYSNELLVGEGLFSTLSGSERFSLPCAALLSIENMKRWTPPSRLKRLVIARDNGAPGEAAAEILKARAEDMGIWVRCEAPDVRFDDFNSQKRGLCRKT